MYTVTSAIHFCYGHRLLNHQGRCRHLHGHNAKVEITLSSETLDQHGMVRDFEDIKAIVQEWIDEHLDHKMILSKDDPMVSALQSMNEACTVIDRDPTAEVIAKLVFDNAASQGLPIIEVRLWEGPRSAASYRLKI